MFRDPVTNEVVVEILAVVEGVAVANNAISFKRIFEAVREWRGLGYRFDIREHARTVGSITPAVVGNADEMWFFGTQPKNEAESLTDVESEFIQSLMDKGLGVFATGDHGTIGANLCGRLPPRVANMRKWEGAGIPSQQPPASYDSTIRSPDRKITDMPGVAQVCGDSDEFDVMPKPIWVSHGDDGSPHELMQLPMDSGRKVPIRFLPDHMHEGRLFDFVGGVMNGELAALAAEYSPGPVPYIVARSVRAIFDAKNNPIDCVSYPVVSAYESSGRDNRGNIVVDSTFHHWTDANNNCLDEVARRHVEQYAINVANWLLGKVGRRKIGEAVKEHIGNTTQGRQELIERIGDRDETALVELAAQISPQLNNHRLVADTVERLVFDSVISSNPDRVEELVEEASGLEKERLERFSDADRQRIVLGLKFELLRQEFSGKQ